MKLRVFTSFSGYDSQLMALRDIGADYEVVGILFAGWICYGISWLIEVIIPPYPGAYYYTCFETEAYNHEDDPDYLKRRIPFWGWISCIPNRKVKHK